MYSTVNRIFHVLYFDPDFPTFGLTITGLSRVCCSYIQRAPLRVFATQSEYTRIKLYKTNKFQEARLYKHFSYERQLVTEKMLLTGHKPAEIVRNY
jgi:hypothetical protein